MLKKIALAGTVALVFSSSGALADVQTATAGSGKITFKGTVVDAPCGIDPLSVNQTIDFGQISKTALNNNGTSEQKDVDIRLVNCAIDTAKTVTVSFSGGYVDNTPNELNALGPSDATNNTTGVAIVMASQAVDKQGDLVSFDGKPGKATTDQPGDNTLHYTAWVKKATGASQVNPGDFSAVTNFVLTYQ
ncbi:fimbrial protein [Klebsiella pneumoniae]|uniref:fimbrial protein n=1 Tax=Klebsiella pneumoniae TaxID=573 RepID=UPI001264C5A1|nr:fimbrial protein [Klebsiella pneumoniae]KAB7923962.1 fimbrial protein [Klebsiella pneumoniae]